MKLSININSNSFFIPFLLGIVFLLSCNKDSDIFTPNTSEPDLQGNINNFYREIRNTVPYEDFTISTESENAVTTKTGLRIIIPQAAFTDSLNNTVKGNVLIRVIQLSQKSDFIKFSQFSNTDSLLLDWYKNIDLEVYFNNQKLKIDSDKSILIQIPNMNISPSLKIFNGKYSSTREFRVIPSAYSNIKNSIWKDGSSGSVVEGFEFSTQSLGWICICTPSKIKATHKVKVHMPANYRSFNTLVLGINSNDNIIYRFDDTKEIESVFVQNILNLENLTIYTASDQKTSYFSDTRFYEKLDEEATVLLDPKQKSIDQINKELSIL